jgi:DNA repair exonuclease SbcCD ATPase subunit
MTSLSSVIYWQDKCSDAVSRAVSKEKEIKRLNKMIREMQATETKTRVTLTESQNLCTQYNHQFNIMLAHQKTQQAQLTREQQHVKTLQAQIQTLEAHLNKMANPCPFCGAGVVTTCRMECANSLEFSNSFLNV